MNIKETSQTNYFQLQAVLGSPPYYSNRPAYGTLDPDYIKRVLPFLTKPCFIEPPYGVLLDGPAPRQLKDFTIGNIAPRTKNGGRSLGAYFDFLKKNFSCVKLGLI